MYEINFHTKISSARFIGLLIVFSSFSSFPVFGQFESTKLSSIRKVLDGKVRNFSPTKISSFTVCTSVFFFSSFTEAKPQQNTRTGLEGKKEVACRPVLWVRSLLLPAEQGRDCVVACKFTLIRSGKGFRKSLSTCSGIFLPMISAQPAHHYCIHAARNFRQKQLSGSSSGIYFRQTLVVALLSYTVYLHIHESHTCSLWKNLVRNLI